MTRRWIAVAAAAGSIDAVGGTYGGVPSLKPDDKSLWGSNPG